MLSLFARFVARLGVGRKLMLIYLLDLTAVIYVSGILINEKYIAIDFARKETQGNAYVAVLRDAVLDTARLGTGINMRRASAGHAQALAEAEQQHGAGMQSADAVPKLQQSLATLQSTSVPPPDVAAVIERTRELITRIGNQSNLILDPDLDSYYSMSLVVLRYPELLEVIDAVGTHLRRSTASAVVPSVDARTRYLILEGRLDAIHKGIVADIAEAEAAGGEGLASALRPLQAALAQQVERYRALAREQMDRGATMEASAALQQAQAQLIDALERSWTGAAVELERLLEARIALLYQRMWLHLGTALALLLTILGVVTFVARQIAGPLRHLSSVADTVRRTGDHSLRAHWESGDEIGRLVAAFNRMLGELDREREAQKELAATARAAEAQRALVESTPIPLMVTAIPGHEVLHANPPAEAWLAGRRSDPWKSGLEPAVRTRFFQALADRGVVDEFEVRWKADGEPAWAVLSARRVNFQGQDAVLTAFTPINHLKLMERRLELWAKVFEASNEAILIVDGERRVMTANRAFTKSTGFELAEVVGEPADRWVGELVPSAAIEAMWQAASTRNTWQGEVPVRRRDNSVYPAWVLCNAVRQGGSVQGPGSVSHYILTSIDISDRKKSEERIRFLADHDVLTELPNRALCTERLRVALQQAARSGQRVAVLLIDLDRFKDINDTLGHHIGDGLLRSVSRRLLEAVRAGDTVSRLGGDEFVVVLNGVVSAEEASQVVEERLIPLIREPHAVEGAELQVSCSVGIAIYPDDAHDIDTLMKHADVAMYQAKAGGRNKAAFFTPEMNERAQARRLLEANLRQALDERQFELHWQPRVACAGGELMGVEGLLRWRHPELGLVAPGDFIPAAEQSGLIVPIGAWVIEEACQQLARWRARGETFNVSINLSAAQLRQPGLVEQVAASLERHGIAAGALEMELTETVVMDDAETNLRQLHALRALGVTLAIDDFGTGYSSLAYLRRFPIDKLKIDRSFVHDMLGDPADRAIIMAIIKLGHTLGLKVVAEGVEREAEALVLREARCDELQGFLYARPMPVPAFERWCADRERMPAAA